MRAFKELVGKEVEIYPHEEIEPFKATVIGFEVDDYYFYEKNETINVYVHVEPVDLETVDKDIEEFKFSLSDMRLY
tara:strand:- start:281 stop:508 length:228 start_codon:yes stop_codon:yes gene_type:complete